MKIIHTNAAPAAVGPYSQAVVSGGMVYTAGQVALDPETGAMVGKDVVEQAINGTKQVIATTPTDLFEAIDADAVLVADDGIFLPVPQRRKLAGVAPAGNAEGIHYNRK